MTDKRAIINIDVTDVTPGISNAVRVINELDEETKNKPAIGQVRSTSDENNSSLANANATVTNKTDALKSDNSELDDTTIAENIENSTKLNGNIQFDLINAEDVCDESNSSPGCLESRFLQKRPAISADYVSENIGQDMYDLYTGNLTNSQIANNETMTNSTNLDANTNATIALENEKRNVNVGQDNKEESKDTFQPKIAKLPTPKKHKKSSTKHKKLSTSKGHKVNKVEHNKFEASAEGSAGGLDASGVESPFVTTEVGEDTEDFDDDDEGPDEYPHDKKVIEGGSDQNDESRFESYIKSHPKKYEKEHKGHMRHNGGDTHHTGNMRHINHLHRMHHHHVNHMHHASPYMDDNNYADFIGNSNHNDRTHSTVSNDMGQMSSFGGEGHMVYTNNPCQMHDCIPSYHSHDNIYRYTPHYIPEHSVPVTPDPGSHEGDLLAHWSEVPHSRPVKVYNANSTGGDPSSTFSATQFLDNTHYPELMPQMMPHNYAPYSHVRPMGVPNVQPAIANLRVTSQHKDPLHNQVHLFTGPSVQVFKSHDSGRLGFHTQQRVKQILQHDNSVNAILHSGSRKIGEGGDIVVDNGVSEGRVAMAHAAGHSTYDPLLSVGDQATLGEPSLANSISPVIDDSMMNGNSMMMNNEMNEQAIETEGESTHALLGVGNAALSQVLTHHDAVSHTNDLVTGNMDDQGDFKVLVDSPSNYMNNHHDHNEVTLCNSMNSPGCNFFDKHHNRTR